MTIISAFLQIMVRYRKKMSKRAIASENADTINPTLSATEYTEDITAQ